MSDEKDFIFDVLAKQKAKQKSKSKTKPAMDKCAIDELVHKMALRDQHKIKPVSQWNNNDFINFIDVSLKVFGAKRCQTNIRRDSVMVSAIYDALATILGSKMSNQILREYLEWWTSIYADRHVNSGVYLNRLADVKYVGKFCKRYADEADVVVDKPKPKLDLDHAQIYELGGLPMLLIKRGIVIACNVLQQKNSMDWRFQIEKSLDSMNKKVLEMVEKATLDLAPYDCSAFDFINMTKAIFAKNSIQAFDGLNYKSVFTKGEK